jgi:glycerol-3-phosphate dehydrogenase
MQRDLNRFVGRTFDVVIVGGGIYGACAAWDAALRGLSVALVEQGDFGQATSANSQKIIHGGLRYLRSLDVVRMRESVRERRTLLRIAPHLVRPMPCLLPTSGSGARGRAAMRAALLVNDLLSWDRNRGLEDPAQRIPACRLVSREECLRLVPGLSETGLTGGALWHDGQLHHSERLTLAFVRSAVEAGAVAANYVRVTGFLRERGRVAGVVAEDVLGGGAIEVRGSTLLNTSGPWVDRVLGPLNGSARKRPTRFVKAISLLTRPLPATVAVGVAGRSGALLFLAPWRGRTLIGTAYAPSAGEPDGCRATEAEIRALLSDVNAAYPAARLTRHDVLGAYAGLLPASGADAARRYTIIDHARHGASGLLSVIGVKYTTARDVAEKAVTRVLTMLDRTPVHPASRTRPLAGGRIGRLDAFLAEALRTRPAGVSEETMRRLAHSYGAAYPDVLRPALTDPSLLELVAGSSETIRAEVAYAVQDEMAVTLADVVFRRTDLGSSGAGAEALEEASRLMAGRLGWDEPRRQRELAAVRAARMSG